MPTELASRPRPLTCLVTDCRRWLDESVATVDPSSIRDFVASRVAAAAHAGVDVVQVREPALPARDLFELVRSCVETARGTDTLIVVNERADVALAAGADGVHLRASSLAPAALRQLVPAGFLIGRSVHGDQDVLAGAGAGADYLIAGTVFTSRSKPSEQRLLGPEGLERTVAASSMPVLGIGGVTLENACRLWTAGAAGLAAIDLFGRAGTMSAMRDLVGQLRAAYESCVGSPRH